MKTIPRFLQGPIPDSPDAPDRRNTWAGEFRRASDSAFLELLERNTARTEEVIQVVEDLRHQLEVHRQGDEALLKRLVEGYPNDDPKTHREYHEKVMRALERKEKFRDAVIEKTFAGLVWSMLIGVGAALWQYVKDHLK